MDKCTQWRGGVCVDVGVFETDVVGKQEEILGHTLPHHILAII